MPRPPVLAIVEDIADRGYAIVPAFLSSRAVATLRGGAIAQERAGGFATAAVGRGASRTVRGNVRGDRIRWIEADRATAPERRLLATLDVLRVALNRELQLGLSDLEAHYAIYPAGAGYARHVDRFRDDDARVLSLVLYLNARWRAEEGGALRIDAEGDGVVEVAPRGGTLVAFLSERFPHEVLPATRTRMSIAGWLRRLR